MPETSTEFEPRVGQALWVATQCPEGQNTPARVSYTPTLTSGYIVGQVLDARTGDPLEGVTLYSESNVTGSFAESVSDPLGRFQLGPLELGNDYVVTASKSAYSSNAVDSLALPPQGLSHGVELGRAGVSSGKITDPLGRPVVDAGVLFAIIEESPAIVAEARTDDKGVFCICDLHVPLQGVEYEIWVIHPHWSCVRTTRWVNPCYNSSDHVKVDVVMPERAIIQGDVTIDGAQQRDESNVIIQIVESSFGILLDTSNTFIGADGMFRKSVNAPAVYRLKVYGAGTTTAETQVSVTAGSTVSVPTISLQGPGRIVGAITDLVGNPLAGARVELIADNVSRGPVRTAADGTYVFEDVVPNQVWAVVVTAPAAQRIIRFPRRTGVVVTPGETITVNIAVDTEVPSVNIISPTTGAVVSGGQTVTVQVSDNQSIYETSLILNGQEVDAVVSADRGNPATWEQEGVIELHWDASVVPNGSHEMTVLVSDLAGNTSTDVVLIVVSNEPV